MIIDPHVHLRDWGESNKETLYEGLRRVWLFGISAVFEMPNTDPPIIHEKEVRRRIHDADKARERIAAEWGKAPFHGLYMGLAYDESNTGSLIRDAVAMHEVLFPRVVGLKFYASHTTGTLGIVEKSKQRSIYARLAKYAYRGVLAVHCEHDFLFKTSRWNPLKPHTHSAVQPWQAEYQSVKDHIAMARQEGFAGTLYICHVSSPHTARYINRLNQSNAKLPFNLVFGLTPHHLLFNTQMSKALAKMQSNTKSKTLASTSAGTHTPADIHATAGVCTPALLKVNPPLRSRRQQRQLYKGMRSSYTGFWIESDHAPHTYRDKVSIHNSMAEEVRAASGFPGLRGMALLYHKLKRETNSAPNSSNAHNVLDTREVFDTHNISNARDASSTSNTRNISNTRGHRTYNSAEGLRKIFCTQVCDVFGIDISLFPSNPNLNQDALAFADTHVHMHGRKGKVPELPKQASSAQHGETAQHGAATQHSEAAQHSAATQHSEATQHDTATHMLGAHQWDPWYHLDASWYFN